MGRPKGTKNIMRTPEEKEKLVLEYFKSRIGYKVFARQHGIAYDPLRLWIKKYNECGIEGLKSNVGKGSKGCPKKPKTRIEQLEQENLRLKIEVERLKKGYFVKGDGARKEYVTSLEKNTR